MQEGPSRWHKIAWEVACETHQISVAFSEGMMPVKSERLFLKGISKHRGRAIGVMYLGFQTTEINLPH